MKLKKYPFLCWFMVLVNLGATLSCAPVKAPQPKVVQPPFRYPNSTLVKGIAIAVVPFDPRRDLFADPQDPKPAKPDFNWFKAGVCPTRLIFANDSPRTVAIDPGQTTCTDAQGATYKPFSAREAADAVIASQVFVSYVKGALKGALLGAALAAGVGAAVGGIAGGGAGRGAAAGAIWGSVPGLLIGAGTSRSEMEMRVRSLLTNQQLAHKTMSPGMTHDGLVFFPAVIMQSVMVLLTDPESRQTFKAQIPVVMPPQVLDHSSPITSPSRIFKAATKVVVPCRL